MRWFMTCGAICGAILGLMGGAASADTLYEFPIGTWSAGAYSKQSSRQFNHCAAAGNYNSGITMCARRRAAMPEHELRKPLWRLTQDRPTTLPSRSTKLADRRARDRDRFQPGLSAARRHTELFQRFARAISCVAAAGQVFAFNLTERRRSCRRRCAA
jgi:hypothetical protein